MKAQRRKSHMIDRVVRANGALRSGPEFVARIGAQRGEAGFSTCGTGHGSPLKVLDMMGCCERKGDGKLRKAISPATIE
jgi:hypothetical protein